MRASIAEYLRAIGVLELAPLTSPFDPGYDANTLQGHLQQSSHIMSGIKISMACWMIADEEISRIKVSMARRHGVIPITVGGPFEEADDQGHIIQTLAHC